MPIAAADVVWNYTVNTGPGLSTAANANRADSIGGFASSTAWAGGTIHDLFDLISGTENTNLNAEYRCIFVRNAHATLTMENVRVYLTDVAGGADASVGLDPTGVVSSTLATAQAKRLADEDDSTAVLGAAPAVTFSDTAVDYATGLAVANIPAGSGIAVWFRRTAGNSAAINNDGATFGVGFDTAA